MPVEQFTNSSLSEVRASLGTAKRRLWLCQTWFPDLSVTGSRIVQSMKKKRSLDVRILLSSFAPNGHIRSRMHIRKDLGINREQHAMLNIKSSVSPFSIARLKKYIRFNVAHHPGWLAIIDNDVFWGPTPVDVDNWSNDFLFHKDSLATKRGKFWEHQFGQLWEHGSIAYDDEKKHNTELYEYPIIYLNVEECMSHSTFTTTWKLMLERDGTATIELFDAINAKQELFIIATVEASEIAAIWHSLGNDNLRSVPSDTRIASQNAVYYTLLLNSGQASGNFIIIKQKDNAHTDATLSPIVQAIMNLLRKHCATPIHYVFWDRAFVQ